MPIDSSAKAPDDPRDSQPNPPTGLLLVSTPIGNLADISERARHTLAACDIILCEDTRRTGRLLSAFDIHVRMEALHDHNEEARIPSVLARLRANERIGLVTDAGTPVVSDPGYRLVRAAVAAGLPVTAIPGPNAAVTALVLSALPPAPFLFLGFPQARKAARRAQFSQLRSAERAGLAATMIWYEAPHRLTETLGDLLEIFGNRPAAVARELTKRFETVKRDSLERLLNHFLQEPARGEITVVVSPPEDDDLEDLDGHLRRTLATHSVKDAAALVSTATGLPRKTVYARALQISEEQNPS
jgi:16S rRNA (cytidine1402-2'-O)-methyltransferase